MCIRDSLKDKKEVGDKVLFIGGGQSSCEAAYDLSLIHILLKELGVEFRFGVEVGKNMALDALRADGYKAIYLAVGASKGTPAGCPGEDVYKRQVHGYPVCDTVSQGAAQARSERLICFPSPGARPGPRAGVFAE